MAGRELRVPSTFRRGQRKDEDESIASAVGAIEHMCADLGLADLGSSDVLDVGCGVKFTQALLNHDAPVQRYVGVDVYREMIEFLQATVDDPRFEYYAMDIYNERYNRGGAALTATTEFPIAGRTFDVICLFSVFTHLAPDDYRAMLQVLRRYAAPDGRLFFTLYIDAVTEGGHGLMDAFARTSGADFVGAIETFKDLDPERPLLWAVYAEDYARELIAGTGWDIVALRPPDPYMQHHFICAPTS
jgi:SAM-dependent methyltransferase